MLVRASINEMMSVPLIFAVLTTVILRYPLGYGEQSRLES